MNNNSKEIVSHNDLVTIIEDYISKSSGLSVTKDTDGVFAISQKGDSKRLKIKTLELADVLTRRDADGKEFIQINFQSGKKILLTDQLVGFKPMPVTDLDVTKLPKVVTTLDLLSVFEAIEESVTTTSRPEDTETLKKVFHSILMGAEDVGFDISTEKSWLRRLPAITSRQAS
jgi:hypothetical protein